MATYGLVRTGPGKQSYQADNTEFISPRYPFTPDFTGSVHKQSDWTQRRIQDKDFINPRQKLQKELYVENLIELSNMLTNSFAVEKTVLPPNVNKPLPSLPQSSKVPSLLGDTDDEEDEEEFFDAEDTTTPATVAFPGAFPSVVTKENRATETEKPNISTKKVGTPTITVNTAGINTDIDSPALEDFTWRTREALAESERRQQLLQQNYYEMEELRKEKQLLWDQASLMHQEGVGIYNQNQELRFENDILRGIYGERERADKIEERLNELANENQYLKNLITQAEKSPQESYLGKKIQNLQAQAVGREVVEMEIDSPFRSSTSEQSSTSSRPPSPKPVPKSKPAMKSVPSKSNYQPIITPQSQSSSRPRNPDPYVDSPDEKSSGSDFMKKKKKKTGVKKKIKKK